ncbi:uncharacterized protein [Dermacentor albipictus]|uniref:uncharacterized protein isoform X1 n=1 Tax=Dermacentor albipictus TaxID=60249 RepID=UPI0038FC0F99
MLALVSPSAPIQTCPTMGERVDAVQDQEPVTGTCGLHNLPSFLDVPLDGHRIVSGTTSLVDSPPFPSPFKSSLLMNYSFSGHASSTSCTIPHAQLFFAPQIFLMLALVSPSAPIQTCPTMGERVDAVQDQEPVTGTCGLHNLPSFLDVPLVGHRIVSGTTSLVDSPPFPSPFKSSLLMNYSFSGHASSISCTMPHAQLFFAPQVLSDFRPHDSIPAKVANREVILRTVDRLTSAPIDRNAATAVQATDHGGALPAGTLGTVAAGAIAATVSGHDQAAQGRNATNVPSLLQKKFTRAIRPFHLGWATTKEKVPPGWSPSIGNSTFPFYEPRTPLTSTVTRRNHTRMKPEFFVGILSSVLLAFVLVVGFVKIALFSSPATSKLCVTHACQAYSLQLVSSINRSVDPCVHFTRFVCDGWQGHHNLDVWERHFLHFINRLDARLKTIDVPAAGQNEEQRAAAVYCSCDNVYSGKSDELAAVKAALALAGIVWPQQSRGADALFALLYSSFKLGWDAVANFRVAPSSGAAEDELVISQGTSLGLLRERFAQEKATAVQRDYYEYIRRQFTGDSGTTVDGEVSYESVWEIAATATKALTPFFGSSEAAPQHADWLANSYGANHMEAPWTEALRRVDITLPGGLRISADNRAFLEALFDLWEYYGEDNFHLFVSWCTVQLAALYANRGLILNYYREIPNRATLYYKAFCLSRAVFFSQAIIASSCRHVVVFSYVTRTWRRTAK